MVDSNNLCEEEQSLKRQAQELQESNEYDIFSLRDRG